MRDFTVGRGRASFGIQSTRRALGGITELITTVLKREEDGTVTVVSLAATWTPALTRESDGSVTVSEA